MTWHQLSERKGDIHYSLKKSKGYPCDQFQTQVSQIKVRVEDNLFPVCLQVSLPPAPQHTLVLRHTPDALSTSLQPHVLAHISFPHLLVFPTPSSPSIHDTGAGEPQS